MVDGAFDPLHRGHIEYFRAAARQLDVPLLCNIASDRYVRTKHPPLLPEDQRAAVVDAIRFISYTHINQFDTETALREIPGVASAIVTARNAGTTSYDVTTAEGASADVQRSITRFAVEAGLTLISNSKETLDLETVFLRLIDQKEVAA